MSNLLPKVRVQVRQRSLGLSNPSRGDAVAIVAPADAGDLNQAFEYGRTGDLQTDYEGGPLVEAAAVAIEVTGRPVVVVRCGTTTPGAVTDLDSDGMTGTAVPAIASAAAANDDYEPYVEFVTGGVVATTGITYRHSLDGGRTLSPLASLGTATSITIPDSGGVAFDIEPAEAEFVAFVVNLRTKALAHFALVSTVHLAADSTSGASVSAAPTNWATGIDVLNDVRAALILHATNNTAHTADDVVAFAALPAAAVTKHAAVALAIAIAAAFAAHLATTASVHGTADATNVLTVDAPTHGTITGGTANTRGDYFSARSSMPKWSDAQLDTALAALQASGYRWKTLIIVGPVTSTATAQVITTRIETMWDAYKYKKVFASFRRENVGESSAAYLAAFKAAFDAITTFQISMSAGALEFQSCATRPRTYCRPPSWLAAPLHVKLGPDVSLAYVNDGEGALPLGATIKDANQNSKHHDEDETPGLDAARALTLRSQPGYLGKVFFTRARTLAALGTDLGTIQYLASIVEILDASVPRLIGQIQAKAAPNPETGRIDDGAANDIEGTVNDELQNNVIDKGYAVTAAVAIDRSINLITAPLIPVDVSGVPFAYLDGFDLSVGLKNPRFSNS